MDNSREEKIDQWMSQEGIRTHRRRRIIPSSTDQISHTPVGTGLDAMEKVAFYFGDRPALPVVEMGQIKEHEVTLSFGEDVHLDEPFYPVSEEYRDHWAIAHTDALALSTGTVYGQQTAALTAIGNSVAGAKVLVNTNRWEVLGSVGLARFTTAIMVGQVMEQATEPWARNQHIWLVGYRELGPKLVGFLTPYHDESRFHLVESIEQITPGELHGTSATIYVMGSGPATIEAYNRLRSQNVGLMTDTVVTEQAMFISEDEDGGATIVNAGPNGLKIWPHLVAEGDGLYSAMDITWQKRRQEAESAAEAVENLTVRNFLPAGDADKPAGSPSISVEELEAMLDRDSVIPEHESNLMENGMSGAPIPAPEPAIPAPPAHEQAPRFTLALLGRPQIYRADGARASGKPAETVAYLHLNGSAADAITTSRALWPDEESEGPAARTRRTRTAKKIKDTMPEIFRSEGEWRIGRLDTDIDWIVATLTGSSDPQQILDACELVDEPLRACAPWADEHRSRIADELRQILWDVENQALASDQFEIAEAARQASYGLQ
ncbi:hypothetical protein [Kocuria rhizosphaericola]|uniref:hypothetical protein n=1 Tax=Kocuria rhizosphaericola TaxID=3376284 RepID=UPI0037A83E6E